MRSIHQSEYGSSCSAPRLSLFIIDTKPFRPTIAGLPSAGARPCQMREAWCVCSVSDMALRRDQRFNCKDSEEFRSLDIVTTRREWVRRSEEHTSELQSLMRRSYAVLCLKHKKRKTQL